MKNVLKTIPGRIAVGIVALVLVVLVGFFVVSGTKKLEVATDSNTEIAGIGSEENEQSASLKNDASDNKSEGNKTEDEEGVDEAASADGAVSTNAKKASKKNTGENLNTAVANEKTIKTTNDGKPASTSTASSNTGKKNTAKNTNASSNSNTSDVSDNNTSAETGNNTDRELSNAEKYYQENAEIIKVIDVAKSKDNPTSKEVTKLLDNKGFTDYPITYKYTMTGKYIEDTEVDNSSTISSPMYETFFVNKNKEIWNIIVTNGVVVANPVSYNVEKTDLPSQLIIAESKQITGYDDKTNKFFEIIPKESAAIVKVVDKIDAATLNKLTCEEIDKL